MDATKAPKDPDQVSSTKEAQKVKDAKKISPALFNKLKKYQLNTTNNVDVLASLNIWTAGDLALVPLNHLVNGGIKIVHARKLKAISLEDVERKKWLKLDEQTGEEGKVPDKHNGDSYSKEPRGYKLPYSVKEPKTHSRPQSAPRPIGGKPPAWAETGTVLLGKSSTPRVTTASTPHAEYWSPTDHYATTHGQGVEDDEIDAWLNAKLSAQPPPRPPRAPPPPSHRQQVRRSLSADDGLDGGPRRFFGGAPVPRTPAAAQGAWDAPRQPPATAPPPPGLRTASLAQPPPGLRFLPPPPEAPPSAPPQRSTVASSSAHARAAVGVGGKQGSFLASLGRDGGVEERPTKGGHVAQLHRGGVGGGHGANDKRRAAGGHASSTQGGGRISGRVASGRGGGGGRRSSWFEGEDEDEDEAGDEEAIARAAAQELIAAGKEFQAARRPSEALGCFEAAATRLRRVGSKGGASQDRALLAQALFLSAAVHRKQGRLEAAADQYEACYRLQAARASPAQDSFSSGPAGTPREEALQLACANTCNDWAMALQGLGDLDGALLAFQKTLRIKGALRGEDHPEFGMALVSDSFQC